MSVICGWIIEDEIHQVFRFEDVYRGLMKVEPGFVFYERQHRFDKGKFSSVLRKDCLQALSHCHRIALGLQAEAFGSLSVEEPLIAIALYIS